MDADNVMATVSENLTIREELKLWRMLTCRMYLLPPDILQDIKEREPELFGPERADSRGNIHFPWQEQYPRP